VPEIEDNDTRNHSSVDPGAEALSSGLESRHPGVSSDWHGSVVPMVYNMALGPMLQWRQSKDGSTLSVRLRDGFGSLLFSVSVPWPFHESMAFDKAGRLNTRESDARPSD